MHAHAPAVDVCVHAFILNGEIWRRILLRLNAPAVFLAGIKLGAQLAAVLPRPLRESAHRPPRQHLQQTAARHPSARQKILLCECLCAHVFQERPEITDLHSFKHMLRKGIYFWANK